MVDPLKEAVAEALFVLDYDKPWDEATSTSRWQRLCMADTAIRAMDRTDVWELFRTMTSLLDGYMPVLEAAANAEAIEEAGKEMQMTTQRFRLKAAQESVERAFDILGITL